MTSAYMTSAYAHNGFNRDRRFAFAPARSRAERIARLDALASLLDTAFILPGTKVRFGLDAFIGLVPGIGDAITMAMSLFIVRSASTRRTRSRPPAHAGQCRGRWIVWRGAVCRGRL
jgi:hypothetical protein